MNPNIECGLWIQTLDAVCEMGDPNYLTHFHSQTDRSEHVFDNIGHIILIIISSLH